MSAFGLLFLIQATVEGGDRACVRHNSVLLAEHTEEEATGLPLCRTSPTALVPVAPPRCSRTSGTACEGQPLQLTGSAQEGTDC